ncbi:general odorant-binding protein 28a-like [Haematobia irritans]|uniref:general odorant-binding protein 28a-like n=1 Tax=Haematobia irritans TaxID=7368 RepID=UPI003F501A23
MKSVGLLCMCVIVLAWAYEEDYQDNCDPQTIKQAVDKCYKEHGVNQADMDDFLDGKPASNERAKCFRACLFDACQLIDDDGTLKHSVPKNSAKLLSKGDPYKQKVIGKTAFICHSNLSLEPNRCHLVENYINCLTENSPVPISRRGII